MKAVQSAVSAYGRRGIVVAGKQQAADIGVRVLEQGGNAADAVAATLLVLSVTPVGAFCIGGEVPVLIYDSLHQQVMVLAGQGAAPLDPQAVSWYLKNCIPGGDMKAATVPTVADLCVTLLKLYGTISFERAVTPTLGLLDAGGPSWYIDTSDTGRL